MPATPHPPEALSRPTLSPEAVVYSRALLENRVWLADQCASFPLFVCMAVIGGYIPNQRTFILNSYFQLLKLVYLRKC